MNKTEFIKAVAAKADLSIKDATAAVDAYTQVIAEALKAGDKHLTKSKKKRKDKVSIPLPSSPSPSQQAKHRSSNSAKRSRTFSTNTLI